MVPFVQVRKPSVRPEEEKIDDENNNGNGRQSDKHRACGEPHAKIFRDPLQHLSDSRPSRVTLSDDEIERGVVPGWSTEDGMNESRWFFYDAETDEILDQIGQMPEIHRIIECDPGAGRIITSDEDTLRKIKKAVDKRIKNTIMRTLQAPAKGAKPRLVCWMVIQ